MLSGLGVRKLLPPFIAFLIRALALAVRLQFEDRYGITQGKVKRPVIWAFWHNRILMVPLARERKTPERHGVVLTSPSNDGAVLAACHGPVQARLRARIKFPARRPGHARTHLRHRSRVRRGDSLPTDRDRGPAYKLGRGIMMLAHGHRRARDAHPRLLQPLLAVEKLGRFPHPQAG